MAEYQLQDLHRFENNTKNNTAQTHLRVLKENIASGNYKVKSVDIAQKMLTTHLLLFKGGENS